MEATIDLRQSLLDVISIEKTGFSTPQTPQKHGVLTIQQRTQPPYQHNATANKEQSRPQGTYIPSYNKPQTSTCSLCGQVHKLWACPKLTELREGKLQWPPNICKQHCTIRNTNCGNPCKETYIDIISKQERNFLCTEHGKLHHRLCIEGTCKDKKVYPPSSRWPPTRHQVNVIQHINVVNAPAIEQPPHRHEKEFPKTAYLSEPIIFLQKNNKEILGTIFYDTYASCCLINQNRNNQRSLDHSNEPQIQNIKFEGCNCQVEEQTRILHLKLRSNNGIINIKAYKKTWPVPAATCPEATSQFLPHTTLKSSCRFWGSQPQLLIGVNETQHFPKSLPTEKLPHNWALNHPNLVPYCSTLSHQQIFQGQTVIQSEQVTDEEMVHLTTLCKVIEIQETINYPPDSSKKQQPQLVP